MNREMHDSIKTPLAIELRNISYSYDKHSFIDNLNLAVPSGKITSIVGPNGCGKSTVLKIIDGILEPFSGEVCIKGKPIRLMDGCERARQLALLAQGSKVAPMTVESLVACGRYPHQKRFRISDGQDKKWIEEAMQKAGVEQFRTHDMRHLSGGERQRAFIAMTLAQNADIIALDEPTTYLDVGACHEIMRLICDLNHSLGKTIVMVIHDLDLAFRYSDYIHVFERGKCLYSGDPAEVLQGEAIQRAFQVEICKTSFEGRESYSLFPF